MGTIGRRSTKTCSFADCSLPHYALGLCKRHWGQQNRGLPLGPLRQSREGTCRGPECEAPIAARGLCYGHYDQERAGGPLKPIDRSRRKVPGGGRCAFDGCDRHARASGLCSGHYGQQNRGEELRPLAWWKGKEPEGCAFDGCDREATSKGLCEAHRGQQRRGQELRPLRAPTGRVIDSHGYVRVHRPDHPNAMKAGWIGEHRLVMSEILGRPLLPHENVHHINGVRDDNRPENLELWSSSQPKGQKVVDKLAWAREILDLYGHLDPLPPRRLTIPARPVASG